MSVVCSSSMLTRVTCYIRRYLSVTCGSPESSRGTQRSLLRTTMSLASTSTIKAQLKSVLGVKADPYFDVFQKFVVGRISRGEFDDAIRHFLDAPSLGEFQL